MECPRVHMDQARTRLSVAQRIMPCLPPALRLPGRGGCRAPRAVGGALGLSTTVPLSGTTWTQQAELTSTAQTFSDGYGSPVAVSGNTAAIGASNTPF